jgi:C4-dicarboxylate transporter
MVKGWFTVITNVAVPVHVPDEPVTVTVVVVEGLARTLAPVLVGWKIPAGSHV